MNRYINDLITNEEVIRELLALAQHMKFSLVVSGFIGVLSFIRAKESKLVALFIEETALNIFLTPYENKFIACSAVARAV